MTAASNSESRKRNAAPVLPLVERIAQAIEASQVSLYNLTSHVAAHNAKVEAARIVRSFAGEDTQ